MKRIELTKGKYTLVDDEDFEFLNQWRWYAQKCSRTFYAMRKEMPSRITICMHRQILDLNNSKLEPDHKDHDGLNNQRSNLRIATRQQNLFNKSSEKNSTSKFKGVHFHKKNRNWRAMITFNGNKKHIGCYSNEQEAATAYNEWAVKLFGEFANLNNIETANLHTG